MGDYWREGEGGWVIIGGKGGWMGDYWREGGVDG